MAHIYIQCQNALCIISLRLIFIALLTGKGGIVALLAAEGYYLVLKTYFEVSTIIIARLAFSSASTTIA